MGALSVITAGDAGSPLFVWVGSYEERLIPKEAGFGWDRDRRRWFTRAPGKALALVAYADELAKRHLDAHQARLDASAAADSDRDIPCPAGLAYLPYQRAGIAYALDRFAQGKRGVLVADEMGLGKTIQALGIINADPSIKRVLVICPASLKLNWAAEARKWLLRTSTMITVLGSKGPVVYHEGHGSSQDEVVVVNYDILKKHHASLKAVEWDLIAYDEAHYCKNPKAQRTEYALGLPAKRRVMLTGTPILNRPVELWPLISALDPMEWRNFMGFALRYCDAHQEWAGRKQVWNFKGSSNLPELQDRLRAGLMVRRLKADVLQDLPPKVRGLVTLEASAKVAKILAREKASWDAAVARVGYEEAVRQMEAGAGFVFETLASDRAALAEAKIGPAMDWIGDFLEGGEGKLVVFAHHHILIDALAQLLGSSAVVVDGRVPADERQALVERFQNDAGCHVFIGSIGAAGVGLTLTAASHVALLELPWRPADVSQAEDRCHRIGQRDVVVCQHLVFDGSLDSDMAAMILDKQAVADDALDADHLTAKREAIAEVAAQAEADMQAEAAKREHKAAAAANLSPDQILAIHDCLRLLAGMDVDRAQVRNGEGFNRLDGVFGHSLAERIFLTPAQAVAGRQLLRKYRRQLPDELYRLIFEGEQAAA